MDIAVSGHGNRNNGITCEPFKRMGESIKSACLSAMNWFKHNWAAITLITIGAANIVYGLIVGGLISAPAVVGFLPAMLVGGWAAAAPLISGGIQIGVGFSRLSPVNDDADPVAACRQIGPDDYVPAYMRNNEAVLSDSDLSRSDSGASPLLPETFPPPDSPEPQDLQTDPTRAPDEIIYM